MLLLNINLKYSSQTKNIKIIPYHFTEEQTESMFMHAQKSEVMWKSNLYARKYVVYFQKVSKRDRVTCSNNNNNQNCCIPVQVCLLGEINNMVLS